MTQQSGKWRGKARIQGGRKPLRDALYMPALVAAKHNPEMRAKYQDMITKGKPPKVALTTIMRKHIDERRPRMDAKHRLTKTDTHIRPSLS
jgi:transposase